MQAYLPPVRVLNVFFCWVTIPAPERRPCLQMLKASNTINISQVVEQLVDLGMDRNFLDARISICQTDFQNDKLVNTCIFCDI